MKPEEYSCNRSSMRESFALGHSLAKSLVPWHEVRIKVYGRGSEGGTSWASILEKNILASLSSSVPLRKSALYFTFYFKDLVKYL